MVLLLLVLVPGAAPSAVVSVVRNFCCSMFHDEVINNTNASVSSIIFLDDDLDNDELGGNITWLPPEDMTQDGSKNTWVVSIPQLDFGLDSAPPWSP